MQILPNDAKARRLFVTSGGLKKIQEIQAEPGTTLSEYITIINCCFPEEIVRLLLIYLDFTLYIKSEKYSHKTILSNHIFSYYLSYLKIVPTLVLSLTLIKSIYH